MPREYECVIRRHSTASPAVLFAIVSDGANWSDWASPLISYSAWDTLGPAGDGGVGAIRAVGAKGRQTREMTTIHEPGIRHGYTILADGPIQNYQADVTLTEDANGTLVTWRGGYETRSRIIGVAYWLVVRFVLGTLSRKLVAAAERREP